jgi:hypothetical protein
MITADETNETNRDITRKNSASITFIDNADSETPADFLTYRDLPSLRPQATSNDPAGMPPAGSLCFWHSISGQDEPHEEVTPLACRRRSVPVVCPDSTVIARRNMRCIVDHNGKIVCQHEPTDRPFAWLPNAASRDQATLNCRTATERLAA